MDLKLDDDGDLALENDDLVLLDGVDAIVQDVAVRLRTFKGEWFLDQRIGIPYLQQILGQKPRLMAIKAIYRAAILTTPGVTGVDDLQVTYDGKTRSISVSFTGQSTEGPFTFDREIIV